MPWQDAVRALEQSGQPFKAEYAPASCTSAGRRDHQFYTSGDFVDMCEGPHVGHVAADPGRQLPARQRRRRVLARQREEQDDDPIYGLAFDDAES